MTRGLAVVSNEVVELEMMEIIDISAGGVRLRISGTELELGTALELEMEIDGESIHAKGEVVNGTGDEVGVRFTEISEDDVVHLELYTNDASFT